MILEPAALSPGAMYRFMISVIVPRPIALISTTRGEGRYNVAPFSYFCGITNVPPLLGVSINRRQGAPKDTLYNIRLTGDFVVNVVTRAIAEKAVHASGDWAEDVDEFALTGLTPVPSGLVRSPRVGESPVNLECRLEREIDFGPTVFVVGEIVRAHVDDELLTDGKVDVGKLRPVGRLGGDGYTLVRQDLTLPRPRAGKSTGGG